MGLELQIFEETPLGRLRCFGDADAAVSHVNKHVLSAPEAQAWRLVASDYAAVVGTRDDDRFQFARRMLKRPTSAQPLYDLYAGVIRAALNDAAELGWYASPPRGDAVAMGLTGLVVIADTNTKPGRISTAFFPYQRPAPGNDEPDCSQVPLCREADPNSVEPRDNERFSVNTSRARRRRLEQRSRLERIYFELFRPARRFVSDRHYIASDPTNDGRPAGEPALLLEAIRNELNDTDTRQSDAADGAHRDRRVNFRSWHQLWKQSRTPEGSQQ